MKRPILGIRLDEDVKTWLRRSAAKQRTTPSELVRRILHNEYLKRHAK